MPCMELRRGVGVGSGPGPGVWPGWMGAREDGREAVGSCGVEHPDTGSFRWRRWREIGVDRPCAGSI